MIEYSHGSLHIDGVAVAELAQQYGTPLYVYSYEQLVANCARYTNLDTALELRLHYAAKANSNISLLRTVAELGFGFDVVSGGELRRCLRIGAQPRNIVYSGVGKSAEELRQAISAKVCINIESEQELERIIQLCDQLQQRAYIAVRVNPHVDAHTHAYIATALAHSKFGVDYDQALALCQRAADALQINLRGLVCHLGSQIETLEPYSQACDSLLNLHDTLAEKHISLEHIGLGGGLAVAYKQDTIPPSPQNLVALVEKRLLERKLSLSLEPGRSIVASSGITVTKVEYIKKNAQKNFAIVDAAMNDIPRPSLYQSWHNITAVQHTDTNPASYDVVGPICESADFLGKDRQLAIKQGDLLAVFDTGAYCSAMASNYNSRPRAAGILIRDGKVIPLRKRETSQQLLQIELFDSD